MADEKKKDPRRVYLKNVRLSYPHLWERQKASEDAAPKFSASFLIDPSTKAGKANIAKIEKAITAAKEQKWGKPDKRIKNDRICFLDGNEMLDDDDNVKKGYEDMMYLKASNKDPVRLLTFGKKPADRDQDPFYGGCYVEAIVGIYGTEAGGSPGVFASLEGVRFFAEGERFGADPISDDEFDDYDEDDDEDGDEDDDPLG